MVVREISARKVRKTDNITSDDREQEVLVKLRLRNTKYVRNLIYTSNGRCHDHKQDIRILETCYLFCNIVHVV